MKYRKILAMALSCVMAFSMQIISAQILMKPDCVLGLATGSTPVGAYKQLAEWYSQGELDFSYEVSQDSGNGIKLRNGIFDDSLRRHRQRKRGQERGHCGER